MATQNINSIQAVVVGAVVQTVVVLAVLVPTIQSGALDPREVENDPLAYTVYMSGGDLTGIDYGISQEGGVITVAYNNEGYTIDTSGGYKSLLISDGVQAVLNGTDMDVYTADGNCYRSCHLLAGGPEVGGIGIMPTPTSEMMILETPSYAYLTIGKSDEAKAVQTNALYGVGDGSTLNGSASLVMVGTQADAIGVSAKDTVNGMAGGKEGGIIIDAGRHIVVTPTSTATESPVDVGGGNEGRTIDEGHIEGVRE